MACSILNEQSDLINKKDTNGDTFLHKLVTLSQNRSRSRDELKQFFDFALSKGADLEVVNDNYETVIERISRSSDSYWWMKAYIQKVSVQRSNESLRAYTKKSDEAAYSILSSNSTIFSSSSESSLLTAEYEDTFLTTTAEEQFDYTREEATLLYSPPEEQTTLVTRNYEMQPRRTEERGSRSSSGR